MAKGKQVFDALDAALVRTDAEEWIQSGDGNQFKVLRISKRRGPGARSSKPTRAR